MTLPWIANLFSRVRPSPRSGRRANRRRKPGCRPQLERLEELTLLSTTNSWTGAGGDGLWNDAKNWSMGLPTAGQDVVITNAGNTTSVTLDDTDGNYTIDSLTSSINVSLTGGVALLTTGGGSVAAGGVTLSGGATLGISGGSRLVIDGGNQSIAGSGFVTFADGNASNQLALNGTTALTIGSGVTVNGKSGSIGVIFNTFGMQTIANQGTIDASVSGGTLVLQPQSGGSSVNNAGGTLEATGGGILEPDAVTITGGTVTTDSGNGSEVIQNPATLTGCTISGEVVATDNQTNTLSGATIAAGGVVDLAKDGGIEGVTGGLTDNGTVNIGSGGILWFQGSQLLTGTGVVDFTDGNANNRVDVDPTSNGGTATLTVDTHVTIEGEAGQVGSDTFIGGTSIVANNGTIDASVSGGTVKLEANGGITNNNLIEVSGGDTLDLNTAITQGSAGVIEQADSACTVLQNGITISGGAIQTPTTGGLTVTPSSGNFLNAVTVDGNLNLSNAGAERVTNGLTLNGTATLTGGGVFVFQGTQSLSGNAVVDFADTNGNNRLGVDPTSGGGTATLTAGPGVTVEGDAGQVGIPVFIGGTTSLTDSGTVDADVSGGTIKIDSSGTFTAASGGSLEAANGGTLQLDASIAVSGTVAVSSDSASQVVQNGVTIAAATGGGTLNVGGSGLVVASSGSNFLGGLTVDGDLNLSAAGDERVTNGLTLNGTATITGGGALVFQGTQSLSGNAVVDFADANGNNRLGVDPTSGGGTATLTAGPGVTVEGDAGQVGIPVFIGGTTSLTDSGTVDADVSGGTIKIDSSGTFTAASGSSLEAANGGTLQLDASIAVSGTVAVSSDSTSQVVQNGVTIAAASGGGTLNVSGSGLVAVNNSSNFLSGLTVDGNLNLSGTGLERVTGGLTLNGTASIAKGGALVFQGDQSFTGNAVVDFTDGSSSNRLGIDPISGGDTATLTAGANVLIEGTTGQVGVDGTFIGGTGILVDGGTINGNVAGGSITVNANGGATFENGSTLEANDGGEVSLSCTVTVSGTVDVSADSSSNVVQNNDTIAAASTGGTLDITSGALLVNGGSNNFLSGLTVDGNLAAQGNTERVTNGLVLNGTATVNGGGIVFSGTQSLTGNAVIDFAAGSFGDHVAIDPATGGGTATLTLGPDVLIEGENGEIGQSGIFVGGTGNLIDEGTIDTNGPGALGTTMTLFANSGTVTVQGGSVLEAVNGGILQMKGTIDATGAVAISSDSTSQVQQLGASITGGTLNITGAGLVAKASGTNPFLNGVTVNGNLILNGVPERVTGGLTLNGTATITNAGELSFDGTQTLSGNAVIDLPDSNSNDAVGIEPTSGGGTATLTLASSVLVEMTEGQIGPETFVGGTSNLINDGTIEESSAFAEINPNGTATNNGTFQVGSGASLFVEGPASTLTNYNTTTNTLTGGTYIVAGTFGFTNANIVVNDANITLDGPNANIHNNVGGGGSGLANFNDNDTGGILTLLDGNVLPITSSFSNLGSLTINAAGGASALSLSAGTTYAQSGSSSVTDLVQGGELLVAGTGSVGIQGGTLEGTGTVQASLVTNTAVVSPGTSTVPGKITINGVYNQGAPGTLDVKLGGTATPGVDYDQLVVSGLAGLSGTINVTEVNGFAPQINNQFQIIDFSSSSGDFKTKNGFYLGGGRDITEKFNPTNLTLVVGQATLQFVAPLTTTVAGKPIDGSAGVQVEILDPNGSLITADETDQITLAPNMNANTFGGGGPITVVNGVATFPDATITKAALNYQLTASSTGFADEPSNLFNIVPDITSQLVFTTEPMNTPVGATINTVTVAEEDQFKNIETGDNSSSMSLTLAPNPGALSGSNPQTVVGGAATFKDLSVSVGGNGYELTASNGTFSQASTPFDITALNTTTSAANAAGTAGQNVTLQATVSAAGSSLVVNEGVVSFEVFSGSTQIGSTVTSGTVSGGKASASFAIPLATGGGQYTIKAFYTDSSGTDFNNSSSDPNNNGTLTVTSATQSTKTSVTSPAPIVFSATASQDVTLSATVTSGGNPVTVGSVTFTVTGISGTLGPISLNTSGMASGTFVVPAGTAANTSGYTITATYNAGSGFSTSQGTGALVINPFGTPDHLAFLTQPQNTAEGKILPAVKVEVLDSNDNVVQSDDTDKIGLTLSTNPSGATLTGGAAATVQSGIATFSTLSVNYGASGYVLTATDTSGPIVGQTVKSRPFTITEPVPTVSSIVINGGAVQRSMVTSITVTFSEEVTLGSTAFSVVSQGGHSEGLLTNSTVVNGQTVVTITFTGADIVGGSLANGNYTLTVDASAVHDLTGQAMATNASNSFFRLFGDARGTGYVDALDYQMFLAAEKTQTSLSIFDYNGDGVINALDLAQFLADFGKTV